MYTLKKNRPPFELVDGPMAGEKFTHGCKYMVLPKGMEGAFELVPSASHPSPQEKNIAQGDVIIHQGERIIPVPGADEQPEEDITDAE